jgi:hypothetical protein
MARTKEDFLNDCDAEDREAYEKLFAELGELAVELGDAEPAEAGGLGKPLGELPLRLRIAFEDPKGASLKLQHESLKAPAALLAFFPSNNGAKWGGEKRVSATLATVTKAGVRPEDATAYGAALNLADFVPRGGKTLRTSTAGEPTGVARVFRWERARAQVVEAVRTLVGRVNAYKPAAAPAVTTTTTTTTTDVATPAEVGTSAE